MKIPFSRPDISPLEFEALAACLASGDLSGDGTYTKKSEQKLSKLLDDRQVLLTHSCTGALEMSMMLANVGPGDEVILPDFTFVSSANAIVVRGAKPVFADVEPDTLCINPEAIADAITQHTKAVMVVHYAGVAADMDAILAVARRNNLFIVEDAAQTLGSYYKGKPLGTLADAGAISFHNTKNISCGEGGALVLPDQRLASHAHIIREKGTNRKEFLDGIVDKYTWVGMGSSYVNSELNASVLDAQLSRFDEITSKRLGLYEAITQHIHPHLQKYGYRLPKIPVHVRHNGHIIWALAPSKAERDRALKFLRGNGIGAVFHFQSLAASPAGKKYGRQGSPVTVSTNASDCLLRLPIYSNMRPDELSYLLDQCKKCWP